MAVVFNHTIVWSRDARGSAQFLAEVLGLPAPRKFYHFEVVTTANGVNLDFADKEGEIRMQHYAFLVSEPEFGAIFNRITQRGLDYWADAARSQPREINHHDGGRGIYFQDPSGHLLEIITRPYGSGSSA
jgi:catechol 2,3-dioxygenase-like lactoylglutathione lyase family enzyme